MNLRLFAPNIDRRGRLFRGALGILLLLGAVITGGTPTWLTCLLAAGGSFALFEALRGWCLARACGLRTRL